MSGPDHLAMLVARLRNLERSMSFQSRDVAGARVCRLSAEAITELRGEIASLTAERDRALVERDDAMALPHAAYKTLPQPITVQDAARALVAAVNAGAIDPFDCTDLAVEALAIKHAGNRRDGVGQLEIAEEFFVAALTAIAEGRE